MYSLLNILKLYPNRSACCVVLCRCAEPCAIRCCWTIVRFCKQCEHKFRREYIYSLYVKIYTFLIRCECTTQSICQTTTMQTHKLTIRTNNSKHDARRLLKPLDVPFHTHTQLLRIFVLHNAQKTHVGIVCQWHFHLLLIHGNMCIIISAIARPIHEDARRRAFGFDCCILLKQHEWV